MVLKILNRNNAQIKEYNVPIQNKKDWELGFESHAPLTKIYEQHNGKNFTLSFGFVYLV
jgi:hypothetical protein